MANAKRVEFYAFGGSVPIAMDAQHKFFRLKIPSSCISDPHIQFMSANSLNDRDVVVAISQSRLRNGYNHIPVIERVCRHKLNMWVRDTRRRYFESKKFMLGIHGYWHRPTECIKLNPFSICHGKC